MMVTACQHRRVHLRTLASEGTQDGELAAADPDRSTEAAMSADDDRQADEPSEQQRCSLHGVEIGDLRRPHRIDVQRGLSSELVPTGDLVVRARR